MNTDNLIDDLPGFDEPVAMLRACHDRILAHCELLEKLVTHLDENGIDDKARKAAADIVRYFSTAGQLHHRDEEEDLFPKLNRQSLKIADLVNRLKQDHLALDALWLELLPDLKKLPDAGCSETFRKCVETFCQLTREHVQLENMEFLPLVASSLSKLELRELGQSMAERRGIRL